MNDALRRWFLRLRYEHASIGLLTLRAEIYFARRWIERAESYVEQKQFEVERLRRDLEADESLLSIERRAR